MTTDPAYYLSIYIHAHKTGNSVPPHIEAEAIAALKAHIPEPTTMSGFLATKEAVEGYLRDTSAQLESTERPIWTEGVCGDGAAILKDGVMQPIEDVIAALNAAEAVRLKSVAATDEEVENLADVMNADGYSVSAIARAVIAAVRVRYEHSTIAPVSLSERLPESNEMNYEAEIWIWEPAFDYPIGDTGDYDIEPSKWTLRRITPFDKRNSRPWLPHFALPIPTADNIK
jgi:hypothetical protein